jgi:hypothetical protein
VSEDETRDRTGIGQRQAWQRKLGQLFVGGDRDDERILGMQVGLSERGAVNLDLRMRMPFEAFDSSRSTGLIRRTSSSNEGSGASRSSCIKAQRFCEETMTSCAPA